VFIVAISVAPLKNAVTRAPVLANTALYSVGGVGACSTVITSMVLYPPSKGTEVSTPPNSAAESPVTMALTVTIPAAGKPTADDVRTLELELLLNVKELGKKEFGISAPFKYARRVTVTELLGK
jgi:hypothetical protein